MHVKTVAIWGMGLLGGSLGLALRQRKMAERIIGVGRSLERLNRALELKSCDEISDDPAQSFAQSDLVILCAPVAVLADSLPNFAQSFKPGTIVTDVGSTKRRIAEVADECMPASVYFVGSHPMSGGESGGVEFARADLYAGNPCFITPTPRTNLEALATVSSFWQELGSRVVITDAERHDRLASAISHVPRITSAALALLVQSMLEDENFIASIAGNGFWSMTRLAKGDLTMWSEICRENGDEIVQHLDQLISILQSLRTRIDQGNVDSELERAREYRIDLEGLRPSPPESGRTR